MTSSDVLMLNGGHSTCVLTPGALHLKNLPEKFLNHQLRTLRQGSSFFVVFALVVNFDPTVGKEQQAALGDILGQLCPIPWQKKAVETIPFSWNVDTKAGLAHAKMENGKGEVTLERVIGSDPRHEVIVHNLKYWGAHSNEGFRLWKSKHEAFELDHHPFLRKCKAGSAD